MHLVQLTYVSSESEKITPEILDKIIDSSVRHNTLHGITGVLLYSEGNFLQVIEGAESAIDETYARICNDPRHNKICLLSLEPIAKREFASWSMGLRHIKPGDAEVHPDYAPLFANGFDAEKLGQEPSLANKLIKQFTTT